MPLDRKTVWPWAKNAFWIGLFIAAYFAMTKAMHQ